MKCINCDKEYTAFNEDAGTYKEHFCSIECQIECEEEIEDALILREASELPSLD